MCSINTETALNLDLPGIISQEMTIVSNFNG